MNDRQKSDLGPLKRKRPKEIRRSSESSISMNKIEADNIKRKLQNIELYEKNKNDLLLKSKQLDLQINSLENEIYSLMNDQKMKLNDNTRIKSIKKVPYIRITIADILDIVEKLYGEKHLDKVISEINKLHTQKHPQGSEIKISYNKNTL